MASIGWLVIGTNRYRDLAIRCLSTIRANYNGALSSRYLLFTDQPKACSHDWVETIRVEHEQFPGISLQRYRHFHRHASRLASCTYLLRCQSCCTSSAWKRRFRYLRRASA